MAMAAWLPPTMAADSEKLLRRAWRQDESLGDVGERYADMVERQGQSNVFEGREMQATEQSREKVRTARSTAMRDVLDELSRGVREEDSSERRQVWVRTKQHYEELLAILLGIRRRRASELEARQRLREQLEEQRLLLEDTQRMQESMQDRRVDADTIEGFAELAERQEQLRIDARQQPVQQSMQRAEDALAGVQPEPAVTHQREAIRRLEEELAAEQQAEDGADAAGEADAALAELVRRIEEMRSLSDQLERVERELRDAGRPDRDVDPAFQQEKALELNDAAKQLRDMKLEPAADDALAAIPKMMIEEWKPAADDVRSAREKLDSALAQLIASLAERTEQQEDAASQQQRPDPNAISLQADGESRRRRSSAAAEKQPDPVGSGWLARLPERERDAVLAARRAHYDVRWEQEVKRYFVELAR